MKGLNMVKRVSLLALLTAISLGVTAPATAQSDTQVCQAFGNFGGIVTDYILPLSVKDFASMNAGKNQSLAQGIVAKIDRELTQADKQALTQIGDENAALLEEAAADFAMDLTLTAQVQDRHAAANIMRQECLRTTPRRIVEIQRSSYQNQGENAPQGTTR